jgi:hypothetical protein
LALNGRGLEGCLLNQGRRVSLSYALEDGLDERILLHGEVLLFNRLKQLLVTLLSNQQCFGGPTAFQSDFGSVLEITDHEVALDHLLMSLVPVDIARDRLSDVHFVAWLVAAQIMMGDFLFMLLNFCGLCDLLRVSLA